MNPGDVFPLLRSSNKQTMKLFFSVLITFIVLNTNVYSQTKIYRTNHHNIGFGISSSCSTNEYLDFCVNGPLVNPNQLPVGGYIDNGVQKQNWSDPVKAGGNFSTTNGIFGLGTDGQMYMVSHSEAYTLPSMKWAFQNGPILVKDGKNVRGTSTSKYSRSGIGYTSAGTLIVIIALEPVTFWEFAEMFVKENCVNAIYLDGGPYVGYSDDSGAYGTMVSEATRLQFFNN